MKRKCKSVDITNIDFIESAISDCMAHKTGKKKNKKEIKDFFKQYDNDKHKIALALQAEIKDRNLHLKPTRSVTIIDKSNGKKRVLTIEHIKQQFYDYIADHALDELKSRYGYYQINVRKHGSALMAKRYVEGWMKDKSVKYVIHMDVQKCYPSITRENMMAWLKKHVKNDDLLWLIDQLLATSEQGLPIGSRLSIDLCALYLSDLYHHIESGYSYTRKGKKIKIFSHILFFLDDIFLFGSNARKMNYAVKDLIVICLKHGLKIKENWKLICLKATRKDSHIDILGYRVYRNRTTMRRRDYLKTKKALRRFKHDRENLKKAQGLIALIGLFVKHTDSIRFRLKYNADFYYKLARKVVVKDARSTIFRTADGCNC